MSGDRLTMMAVHAHPDDEIFITGGVYAKAAVEGRHTALVCCTGGEEGEIHDPDLDPEEAKHRLAEIRAAELGRACEILGIQDLHFLGYRDSGMAGTEANADPRNFHNADPNEAVGRLVAIFRGTRPHVVVTYDESGGYGHPDHIATHQRTVEAVEAAADATRFPEHGEPWDVPKLYYGVWSMRQWMELRQKMIARGLPFPFEEEGADPNPEELVKQDERITTAVDIAAYLEKKQAALYVHRTQIGPDFFLRTMPEDLVAEFMSCEFFQLARTSVKRSGIEADLFEGLE